MADRLALKDHLPEFEKRVKGVLWRQDPGPPERRYQYNNWKARIEELETNSGFSHGEAVVAASKAHESLYPLFAEYDVRKHDKDPASHSKIIHYGETKKGHSSIDTSDVVIEGLDMTYRESLQWAMAAAGRYSREKRHPGLCPSDEAWFLYEMAIDNAKDFLMRVGQVEVKASDADENKATARACRRSIEELNGMLEELDYVPEERDLTKINIVQNGGAPHETIEDQASEKAEAEEE